MNYLFLNEEASSNVKRASFISGMYAGVSRGGSEEDSLNFVNLKAAAAAPSDYEHEADAIGCEVAALQAVWQVETGGKSFDSQGRLPALFEPHHFYRLLSGEKRAAAMKAGLAYPRWRAGNYPKDSYPRIVAAMKIDERAALEATSWGCPQIMGFNHAIVGYPSAEAMVEGFLTGIPAQLAAFSAFVKKNRLAGALARKDWAAFARGYNGAGYAKNRYDKKLAQAYAHFKAVKPMAVMVAPLPAPDPLPATVRAETAPQSWVGRLSSRGGS